MLSFVDPEMDWYSMKERLAQAATLSLERQRPTNRLKPRPPQIAVRKHRTPPVEDVAIEPLSL